MQRVQGPHGVLAGLARAPAARPGGACTAPCDPMSCITFLLGLAARELESKML